MTKEEQTKSMLRLESETPAPELSTGSELSHNESSDAATASPRASKMALRKLMVSCIDSALEELGPLVRHTASQGLHASGEKSNAPGSLTSDASNSSVVATNTAPLEDESNPYGYGPYSPEPTKVCPELQLSGRIRRPRYQRRGSVTKFSLMSNAFKQVQAEESKGYLKEHSSPLVKLGDATAGATAVVSEMARSPSQQLLWRSLYCNVDDRPIKLTSLTSFVGGVHPMVADLNGPAAKRRRGMF